MKIYKQAIEKFGSINQTYKAIEELTELSLALQKDDIDNILEEIVDVEIMIKQLKIIYGCKERRSEWKKIKIERLKDAIDAQML